MGTTNQLMRLEDLLAASRTNYDACLGHVDHVYTCEGVTAKMRMHHLKFSPNCQPKLDALVDVLVRHAIDYAIACRNRPTMFTAQEAAKHMQEARKLFRVVAASPGTVDLAGEAGELLLYFLLETILEAPQVVAKLELKTNPALEVNGSDGIHMRWNPISNVVDVYFGESKFYVDVGKALSAAFESIENFHANGMRAHEFSMVTRHFKGTDEKVRDAVAEMLDTGKPGSDARINHACLIGYNWRAENLTGNSAAEVESAYQTQFLAQAPELHRKLLHRFEKCQRKEYGFEVFFLPFENVQAFRDAFDAAMR